MVRDRENRVSVAGRRSENHGGPSIEREKFSRSKKHNIAAVVGPKVGFVVEGDDAVAAFLERLGESAVTREEVEDDQRRESSKMKIARSARKIPATNSGSYSLNQA